MSAFSGFPRGTFRFLRDVSRNNDRAWFEANREAYEKFYLAPARAFVEAIGPRLQKLAPDVQAEPALNKSIRRIHRDTRFSKDKRPYKDYLDIYFRTGDADDAPGFSVRLEPRGFVLGCGAFRFNRADLTTFREHVLQDERGENLVRLVRRLEKAGFLLGGERYKRVPRGFDPQHPRGALLRHDALYVYRDVALLPGVHGKTFATACVQQFRKSVLILDWLREL